MARINISPEHRFNLDYLQDNGTLRNWPTLTEPGCVIVRWHDHDGDDYSVLDANDRPLGWGETPDDALADARCHLTDSRRKADGITPAKVC